MLTNFNKTIKSILLEDIQNKKEEKYIKSIFHCNEFYIKYIEELAISEKVGVTKQMNNVFLVTAPIKNVCNFFNKLKVDKDFIEDPSKFLIYSPMYTFNDSIYEHHLQRGEMYAPTVQNSGVPMTHDVDNLTRTTTYGRWYNFFQKDNYKVKAIKPSELTKFIKDVQKANKFKDDFIIMVSFEVNCQGWVNNVFDEISEYKTVDQINQIDHSKDDFDYDQLLKIPDPSKSEIDKTLKNIKKSQKDYKNNKVK